MGSRWRRHGRDLRLQAAHLRKRLAELVELGANGATRGAGIQALLAGGRANRRRRRLFLIALLVVLAGAALGARHCRTWERLTDAQREQLRADVIAGCRVNNCTPEKLAALLNQVGAFPRAEEDR